MSDTDNDRLKGEMHCLCEAVLDDSLSECQSQRLEHLVKNHEGLRRYYVKYIRQHVLLLERQQRFVAFEALPSEFNTRHEKRSCFGSKFYISSAIVLLLVTVAASFHYLLDSNDSVRKPNGREHALLAPVHCEQEIIPETKTFGTLQVMAKCLWENPDSAIDNGERVGPCLLHLLKGIIQIRYDNGVSLNIEGPSKIELTRFNRCFLHFGSVSAEVSPSGIGFTVDTNSASIEDRGTVFGVKVNDENSSEVRVFSGHVEVRPIGDQISIPVTTGRKIRFTDSYPIVLENNVVDRHVNRLAGNEYVRSTADGLGKEACIISGGRYEALHPGLISKSETLTLVKNASSLQSRWHRKAYFSIDIGEIPVSAFSDAVLEMVFAQTGVGFESRSADNSILSVYGLLDETGDYWQENNIDWSNAPANLRDAAELDLTKVMMIGQIAISASEEASVKRISGNALRRFIETDTNKILTFIVVCETREHGNMGYAYGFANRHHPNLAPPTLRLIRDESGDGDCEQESIPQP